MKHPNSQETFICPVCGGEVKTNALACPDCGSDEKSGWSDETYLDGIDVGDEVDYDEILENEFPEMKEKKKKVKITWVMVVGAVLLLLSMIGFVRILAGR